MRHTTKNVSVSNLSFISLTQIAYHKTSFASYKEDSEYKELNSKKQKSLANGDWCFKFYSPNKEECRVLWEND